MTGPEKAVVAVSFVTLAFALQLQFDPLGSVTDHLSYIAFFFSYAIGNPIAFRIIAMVASVFEIISAPSSRSGRRRRSCPSATTCSSSS